MTDDCPLCDRPESDRYHREACRIGRAEAEAVRLREQLAEVVAAWDEWKADTAFEDPFPRLVRAVDDARATPPKGET